MATVSLLANIADQRASQTAGAASQLLPSGTVLPFAGSTAPSGWILCDGSAINRTTYSALFSAISTTYGSGDGSTTFNVPDCRGIFIAGSGSQTISSITYTRTHGAKQGDSIQGHKHGLVGRYSSGSGPTSIAVTNLSSPATIDAASNMDNMISDGSNGSPRSGTETRPANIAMNYIIKV